MKENFTRAHVVYGSVENLCTRFMTSRIEDFFFVLLHKEVKEKQAAKKEVNYIFIYEMFACLYVYTFLNNEKQKNRVCICLNYGRRATRARAAVSCNT